jgi:hypothetical protein
VSKRPCLMGIVHQLHISLLFMKMFVTMIMLGLLYHKFIIYKICECKEMKNEVNIPFTIKLNL